MPNILYSYILNICDHLSHFVDNIFQRPELIFWTQLNGFKYCNLIRIILYITNPPRKSSKIC